MATRKPTTILGFQFEPERKAPKILRSDNPSSGSESDWEKLSDPGNDELRSGRCNKPVGDWCDCGRCEPMKFEIECKCCHELNLSHFKITKCITENEYFNSIVLLKENLWAVLHHLKKLLKH